MLALEKIMTKFDFQDEIKENRGGLSLCIDFSPWAWSLRKSKHQWLIEFLI